MCVCFRLAMDRATVNALKTKKNVMNVVWHYSPAVSGSRLRSGEALLPCEFKPRLINERSNERSMNPVFLP